jgi:hypothetical protein
MRECYDITNSVQVRDLMGSIHACQSLPEIIKDADRPLALQRLRQTNVLSVVLERMLQLKVGICAARVNKPVRLWL